MPRFVDNAGNVLVFLRISHYKPVFVCIFGKPVELFGILKICCNIVMRLPPVGREYIEGESCIMFAGVGKGYLFFGKETKGLPEEFLFDHPEDCVKLPMIAEARSLNLSNAVAVGVFEALRQLDFPHLKQWGKMKP